MVSRGLAESACGAAINAEQLERFVVVAASPAPDAVGLGRASARAGLGLHQLRYVLAAAEHGGFRRAARQLGVQQSAVSRRIHELETRLGAPIFERGPQGVRLTVAGEDFVRGAQGAMSELDLAVDRAAEAARADQTKLCIGVVAGLSGAPLQALLQQLLERDPLLQIELVEAEAGVIATALAQGRLDVGFLLGGAAQLTSHRAWRDRLLLAAPSDGALAQTASISWTTLTGRRVLVPACIAEPVRSLAARRSAQDGPHLAVLDAAPASVARLVALGQGCAIVNEGEAPRVNGVVYRPLERTFLTLNAVLGRRPEKPVLRRLLGLLPVRG